MDLFKPKANVEDVAREVSALAGENLVLRQAVVLLLRHSPELEKILAELAQDTAVLRASVCETQSHPRMAMAMQDTLDAIRRMTTGA